MGHNKNEKPESQLYITIKVTLNEDLFQQIGRDIYFDLVDLDKVRSLLVRELMPFHIFKEVVAKQFGVPVQLQRFWLWGKRQNHTYRPHRLLTHQEETEFVGQLKELSNKAQNAELNLFLEVELGLDLYTILPPHRTTEDILIFFKLYDPIKEELRYLGKLFVKGSDKPVEILRKLNEMAGFAADEEIELYEEIKFEPTVMCELIDKNLTFHASQLGNGDIICFQKLPPVGSQTQCLYPDVPSFLECVHQRQCSASRTFVRIVENQAVGDLPSSRFTWTIKNFSRLKTEKHYSDVFLVGCYKWRMLIFPKGNNVDHFSMYLYAADLANFPFAKFSLAVVNQIHSKSTMRKDTQHQFTVGEKDWGFTSFIPLSELNDTHRGYIVNDTCIVEAEVAVCKVRDASTSDSKMETGDVGIKNQGALVPEMDQVIASLPEPEMQTKLDAKRNKPVGVVQAASEVQLGEQVVQLAKLVECATPTLDKVTTPMPATKSGEIVPLLEYPGAGQLFEEGRHRQGVLDEKFEDIGGFSILKTQASLYKQIWLKYGHIASSQVLTDSYSGQVSLVTDIMTFIMDMHQHCLTELSSTTLDSWEKKIKMTEKLEFNVRWLRECFEVVKKDFSGIQKLNTVLREQDQTLHAAKARVIAAKDELKKAEENVSALVTRISPLLAECEIYLEKGSCLLFDR